MSDDYCGCCGRGIRQGTSDWCMDCLREHIDTLATRPEEATFYAQHGSDCPFTASTARRFTGWVCLSAFLLSIPFANWWLTQHGLVTVWGHAIPSAVWVVGIAFVVRDLAQLTLGKWWAWLAIAVGVLLSYAVADAHVATASAMAFLWSESTDAAIFTPLANRGTKAFLIGVSISGYAASFVDSAIFMRLAFHSWDFVPLALAKILFVALATPVAWGVRRALPRNLAVRTVGG